MTENNRRARVTLQIAVDSMYVALNNQVNITLTATNLLEQPAEDIVVMMAMPEGVTLISDQVTPADTQHLQWEVGRLAAHQDARLMALLRVERLPDGGAMFLRAQATARDLETPAQAQVGVIVVDPTRELATVGIQTRSDAEGRAVAEAQQPRDRELHARVVVLTAEAPDQAARGEQTRDVAHPPSLITSRPILPPFAVQVTDGDGQGVTDVDERVTVTIPFTSDQLEALGTDLGAIELVEFDAEQGRWVRAPKEVDREARTITAPLAASRAVTAITDFNPSEAYLPTLAGWQTSLFTGAVTHEFPIDVPAGPAGIRPKISLTYNSSATDGRPGLRLKNQAGWAGLGWSLDTGSIALNKLAEDPGTGRAVRYYTLAFNGQAYDLVGELLPGYTDAYDRDPTRWTWRAASEGFVKVRVVQTGVCWDHDPNVPVNTVAAHRNDPKYGRGGIAVGKPLPRYMWQIWTPDGTRYDFAEDKWWGFKNCGVDLVEFEAYQWLLSAITDTHGNTIRYTYERQSWVGWEESCDPWHSGHATVDLDVWPVEIVWGGQPGDSSAAYDTARYKVTFASSPREFDHQFDWSPIQYGRDRATPRETRKLDAIQVWSKPAGTWQLVHGYTLAHTTACIRTFLRASKVVTRPTLSMDRTPRSPS